MARPSRYQALDFTPPQSAAAAAERGLRLRAAHRRGGTAIGVARARDLSTRKPVSPQTVRRMHAYFARHEVDKQAPGWASRSEPSAGYIAWLLWGGDPGRRWSDGLLRRMRRLDGDE